MRTQLPVVAAPPPGPPSTMSSRSEKITQGDFSPNTTRLANRSKAQVREHIATKNAFPADKDTFIWTAIQEAAQMDDTVKQALLRACKSLQVKEDLIDYVRASHAVSCIYSKSVRLAMQLVGCEEN